ncbi:MAG: hypothetical protein IPO07_20530 [Haliscomenobacter sp.]|nr:hypothetical protein [Haliscomenobacter sp.]MBK9490901.1 hypothetical protein [Haliscomenobacter sp.]
MEDRAGGRWLATTTKMACFAPQPDAFCGQTKRQDGLMKVTASVLKSANEVYVGLGNGEVLSRDRITKNGQNFQ